MTGSLKCVKKTPSAYPCLLPTCLAIRIEKFGKEFDQAGMILTFFQGLCALSKRAAKEESIQIPLKAFLKALYHKGLKGRGNHRVNCFFRPRETLGFEALSAKCCTTSRGRPPSARRLIQISTCSPIFTFQHLKGNLRNIILIQPGCTVGLWQVSSPKNRLKAVGLYSGWIFQLPLELMTRTSR